MSQLTATIPESLIYEFDGHEPIYYQGYKAYLNGTKDLEELMGSSYIQSLLITRLVLTLASQLDKKYQVLTSEIGLHLKGNKKRAADIAVFEVQELKVAELTNKYLRVMPKIVIEVDTKAYLESGDAYTAYYHKKTDELLDSGIEKVIWIFTDSRKVMVSEAGSDWQIHNWNKPVNITEDVSINIEKLMS